MDGLNPRHNLIWLVLAFFGCAIAARAQVVAPPPAPPITSGSAFSIESPASPQGGLYSIGDPTNEEQYYLELINRARANPTAEGTRLASTTDSNVVSAYTAFGVNLVLMQTQFALIPPAAPLSMNATLLNAARAHSQNMLANNYQGHSGPDGALTTRLAGYTTGANGWSIGENVYAYAKSVWYGHAGFEVDWGGTALTGGMQSPPGHRQNIHSADFREVGVGNIVGSNGGVGPQLVTQDFGTVGGLLPFVTGVVYRDLNGNGFYDPGEGIGGVTVTIANVNSYAVTAGSGGYSVPAPGNGNYIVTFSGGSVPTSQKNATVANGQNLKVDYVVTGSAPTPTPTPTPTPGASPPKLANISTRAIVGTGANVLIGGFIITGTQSKQVIVRGIGPSLSLPGKLADPVLELHDSSGTLIGFNDNWGQASNAGAISTTGVAPTNPSESAILMNLAPGSYTVVLSGANQGSGAGVVEVYDLDTPADAKLANISTRASVQSGDNVLIGGIIVVGQSPADVIVRAIGPSLPVSGALADPTLELRDASGALVGSNDDWRSTQQAAILNTGVAPTRDAESAIVTSFSPGIYTAIVRGANGTAGVAVVEVYQLN